MITSTQIGKYFCFCHLLQICGHSCNSSTDCTPAGTKQQLQHCDFFILFVFGSYSHALLLYWIPYNCSNITHLKKKKISLLFFLSLYRAKCRLKMPNVDVDNGVKMKRNIAKPVTCCSSTDPKAFLNYLLCFPCSLICVHKSCYWSKWSVLFAAQWQNLI